MNLQASKLITSLLTELETQGVFTCTHSPLNNPIWPAHKPSGSWRLTNDYQGLNSASSLPHTAVPVAAKVISAIYFSSYLRVAGLDIEDMFFQGPIPLDDQARFACTWNGIHCTFTHLPQSYCYGPTTAHGILASILAEIPPTPDVSHYQYTDDIFLGRYRQEPVTQDMIPDFSPQRTPGTLYSS